MHAGRRTNLTPSNPRVDVGRVAIGQGGLAGHAAADGLGGPDDRQRRRPHGAAARAPVIDPDGRTVDDIEPAQAERVMSEKTASELTAMMKQVVKEGTGTAAALEGVEVAGKTGTAELDIARRINQPWFIGFTEPSRGGGDGRARPGRHRRRRGGADRQEGARGARSRTAACTGVDARHVIDGRYRVLNRIGSGGMADVYCAEDTQLGRRVALKLLYRRFAEDQEFVERFRREASAAAGLQHPNVVQVYDRGEWDDTYYIAMEFLEGRSLKQIIREEGAARPGPGDRHHDPGPARRRASPTSAGSSTATSSPHNVIVDDEGNAKVTDFGIARAGASDMTETGSILGTAQYLSPEQAQGHAVSARSDLYSIGIVLYEMLTGRVPFDGDSPVTIALKQISEEPCRRRSSTRPSRRSSRTSCCTRMAKDPAWRFADADEFIAALEAVRGRPATGSFAHVPPSTGAVSRRRPDALEQADRRNLRWLLWLLLRSRSSARGSAPTSCSQPDKVTVPDVVGRHVGERRADAQPDAGFEVAHPAGAERRGGQGPRDLAEPAAARGGRRGLDGHADRLRRPGRRGRAGRRRAHARRRRRTALEKAGFKSTSRDELSDSVEQGRVIEPRRRRARCSSAARRSRSSSPAGPRRSGARRGRQGPRRRAPSARRRRPAADVRRARDRRRGPGHGARADARRPARRRPRTPRSSSSSPRRRRDVEVPDVSGDDLQGARDALHAAGLQGRQTATGRSPTRRRTAS